MTVDCPELLPEWKLKATRLQETLVWPISQHAGTKEAAGQDLYFSDVQMTLAEAKRFPSLGVLRSKPRRTITSTDLMITIMIIIILIIIIILVIVIIIIIGLNNNNNNNNNNSNKGLYKKPNSARTLPYDW